MGGGGARGEPRALAGKQAEAKVRPRNVGLESGRRARSLGRGYPPARARTRFRTHLHDVSASARACEPPTVPRAAPSGTRVRRAKNATASRLCWRATTPGFAARRRCRDPRFGARVEEPCVAAVRATFPRLTRRVRLLVTRPRSLRRRQEEQCFPATGALLAPKKASFLEPHVRLRCHRVAKSERESGVFRPFATLIG